MRIYRASSLGYSLEALVAPHLGYAPVDPPEWLQKAYDEGDRIEPLVIEKLRGMGWSITISQDAINSVGDNQIEVELEVVPDKARVIGHLDGIVLYGAGVAGVLEVKSMNHQSWQAFKKGGWEAKGLVQKYKWQASAYMLATQMPHIMVAWDKDTEEVCWMTTLVPFYTISDIALKLAAAEEAIAAGVVPVGCDDYPCPYFYLHGDNGKVAPIKPDGELEALLMAWLEADTNAKVYEAEKGRLRDQILALSITGDNLAAATIKGECGVTITRTWQKGGVSTVTRNPQWVTKIQGPRK